MTYNIMFNLKLVHVIKMFSVSVNKTLSVTNGGGLGVWASAEFCKRGHHAIGFRMKVCIYL